MTTNQPPRKRALMEVLADVESGELTALEANEEIESTEADAES